MYITPEMLINKYGTAHLIHLTVKEPTGEETEPDLAAINRETGRVNGIIDGYLRARYALPLSEIPPELAGYAEDMAIVRIYGCLPERTVPEDITRAAKGAVAWLRDIQKGLASLSNHHRLAPAPSGGDPGGTGFFRTNKRREDRIFDDATLDRFTGR